MSRLPDGREVLARLELPLSMTVAGQLMRAIAECAESLGYTDVVVTTDGGCRIIGSPPGWAPPEKNPRSGPAAPEEGAPTAPST